MISVIIPTYNTGALIERAVRCIEEQRNPPEFEILAVDDGSTDDTVGRIENFNSPRIRIFRQEKNSGPAAARNRGLREARGEYAAFLDGDDYWEPDFLRTTVDFLEAHPDVVAVSVMQRHRIPGKTDAVAPRHTGVAVPVVLPDFYAFWGEFNHVCTGSVLMRTAAARETGGQREDLRVCEDLEFWALLATYGPWGFIPRVLFTSDGGAVVRENGWLAKNRKRWASAVPIDDWSRRIVGRIPDWRRSSFVVSMGRIGANLIYSMIQSGRFGAARLEVMRHRDILPDSKVAKILKKSAPSRLVWIAVCVLLLLRERLRAVRLGCSLQKILNRSV